MDYTNHELLTFFLKRMGMYIHPINRNTIVSFIHGFETAARSRTFTEELKNYLEISYQIYGSNQGWPRQVELLAENWGVSWEDGFVQVATVILEKQKNP